MNLMVKQIKKINTTSDNMTYFVDNKINQHNELHPLTAIRGKWIPETMYRDIEKNIQHDSQEYITSECGQNLSIQKVTNCENEYDRFCCSDCTKLLSLEIKKKMSALDKLYNLVKH